MIRRLIIASLTVLALFVAWNGWLTPPRGRLRSPVANTRVEHALPSPPLSRGSVNTAVDNVGRSWSPHELATADLKSTSIPLTNVALSPLDTAAVGSFVDAFGITRNFRSGQVLLKLRSEPGIALLSVTPGEEVSARDRLSKRSDVEFAELEVIHSRQSTPTSFAANDPDLATQWHHSLIGSSQAWQIGLGSEIRIAIVDFPFNMTHPDLVVNTLPGWDIRTGLAIESTRTNDHHSTMSAGLAAATINNLTGVAGASNSKVLPINITGTTSEMVQAINWAADNGVRVVNLSWDGCYSEAINSAAAAFEQKTRGMVFMAGINRPATGGTFINYPNQPNIYAVAMTDVLDRQRSSTGLHIDFAAPGHDVFSTTTNAGYTLDRGTSFSTPLVAGIAAFLFSINPDLGPAQLFDILKRTAVDLGTPGWDQTFGWGRIDFARAAAEAYRASPIARVKAREGSEGLVLSAALVPNASYWLYRTTSLNPSQWELLPNIFTRTNGNTLELIDSDRQVETFYRLRVRLP